jgi:hypothetical protein
MMWGVALLALIALSKWSVEVLRRNRRAAAKVGWPRMDGLDVGFVLCRHIASGLGG